MDGKIIPMKEGGRLLLVLPPVFPTKDVKIKKPDYVPAKARRTDFLPRFNVSTADVHVVEVVFADRKLLI